MPSSSNATPAAIGADACTLDEAVAAMVADAAAAEAAGDGELDDGDLLAGLTPEGQRLALRLSMTIAAQAASQPAPPAAEVLPLPSPLRRLLLRQLLQRPQLRQRVEPTGVAMSLVMTALSLPRADSRTKPGMPRIPGVPSMLLAR